MRAFENQRKKYFLNPKCTSSEMPTNSRPAFNIGWVLKICNNLRLIMGTNEKWSVLCSKKLRSHIHTKIVQKDTSFENFDWI